MALVTQDSRTMTVLSMKPQHEVVLPAQDDDVRALSESGGSSAFTTIFELSFPHAVHL